MKRILVCGAGGFIGNHLVRRLKKEGHWVRGADIKLPEFSPSEADEFKQGDLCHPSFVSDVLDGKIDEVFQLAADMGGAGYIFTGDHDTKVMYNSAMINLNMVETARKTGVKKIFFSSSACIYPERNQLDPNHPNCEESSAYPAAPDSEYGWEKLFSERLYLTYDRTYPMDVRIARFHNIFGEEGTWRGGREKSPAALCRKVAEAPEGGAIEMWGDGTQTRSYLHVEECLEGVLRLMSDASNPTGFTGPINIGSEEMVTLNQLAELIMKIAGKTLTIRHVKGPLGVRGRRSHNQLIQEKLAWAPSQPLQIGLEKTYRWILSQIYSEGQTILSSQESETKKGPTLK